MKFMYIIFVFCSISDTTITQCKGAPVMNDDERCQAVKACKWVDAVVPGVPYIMVVINSYFLIFSLYFY
jgi:glycerol-3-phosphate cytidylyltransferase-like family protein